MPAQRPRTGASLVVTNFRTPELVERCLASVAGEEGLERIVVDNGSGDGSAERIAAIGGVRVLALADNRGFAAAVNAGVAAAGNEAVVVLNADTEVLPGAVPALVAALAERDVAIAAPVLQHRDGSEQMNAYRRFPGLGTIAFDLSVAGGYALALAGGRIRHPTSVTHAELLRGGDVEHVMGAAFAVRRAAWEQSGGLDEGFFLYLEETEWQQRLRRAGWRIVVEPHARVLHLVRSGDPTAAVASPHFVDGALRYLDLNGVSRRRSLLALRAALAVAWLTTWTTAARGDRAAARRMRARIAELRERLRRA
jgi:N-acetylglucosaminyl-diphospho-decaprenol L-rhamnosyltransferase